MIGLQLKQVECGEEWFELLRDIPRVYLIMFSFAVGLVGLSVWYISSFNQNASTMDLNEAALTSAVSEVDKSSRLNQGAFLLSHTFEKSVWDKIEKSYAKGSVVQFDYIFDTDDDRYELIAPDESSPSYIVGTNKPSSDIADYSYMTNQPIVAARVKVRKNGDKVGEWTHTATITVDSLSKGID